MDFGKLKNIIESLFDSTCDIYGFETHTNERTGITSHNRVLKYADIKCRVSYSTGLFQGSVKIGASAVDNIMSKQYIKLFLPTGIEISPGCEFKIHKDGRELILKNSSNVYMYKTHQEVLIESKKEYN